MFHVDDEGSEHLRRGDVWHFLIVIVFTTMLRFLFISLLVLWETSAFLTRITGAATMSPRTTTTIYGLFDFGRFGGSGSASKEDLDDQWEAQQEILRARRQPKSERDKYFAKVEQQRRQASEKQVNMWAWQTKQYGDGEDPITEWKKRREDGTISDLDDQYGDEKKIGGIPIPMASFGVGGEFGGT